MDSKILKTIEEGLVQRQAQILKDIEEMSGNETSKVKFPEYGDKPDENAQEVGDYETNIATEASLEGTLRDIDGALKRIKDGTYGTCKYCKKEIGEKRLLARPVASACVPCKTKLQKS